MERFSPSLAPMLLTRTLRKPLGDGNEVLSRRTYEIRFVPERGGYRVDGRLVGVEVETPPDLALFAQLERARPDEGMFPMHVDHGGRFVDAGGNASASPEVAHGWDLTKNMATKARLDAAEAAQAHAFIDVVRKQAPRTEWPRDLFRPVPGERVERNEVPLPDGLKGFVTVRIDARPQGNGGMLASLDRTVTTDLGGGQRQTFETWTLAPKS